MFSCLTASLNFAFKWVYKFDQDHTLGAFHSTKISGNSSPKLNGTVLSNRNIFGKEGPPFEVDRLFRPLILIGNYCTIGKIRLSSTSLSYFFGGEISIRNRMEGFGPTGLM